MSRQLRRLSSLQFRDYSVTLLARPRAAKACARLVWMSRVSGLGLLRAPSLLVLLSYSRSQFFFYSSMPGIIFVHEGGAHIALPPSPGRDAPFASHVLNVYVYVRCFAPLTAPWPVDVDWCTCVIVCCVLCAARCAARGVRVRAGLAVSVSAAAAVTHYC